MADHNWDDRFLDVLLDEHVGKTKAPDVLAQVRAKLEDQPRPKRFVWHWVAAAAAITIALATAIWFAFSPAPPLPPPRSYPAPLISGGCQVEDGSAVGRQARVLTEDDPGSIELGGYVKVHMDPRSTVQISGDQREEAINLERGKVTCDVTPDHGAFQVKSDYGTVAVVGTRFTVEIVESKQDNPNMGTKTMKRMLVKVLTGAVLVTAMGTTQVVKAQGMWGGGGRGRGDEAPKTTDEPTKSASIQMLRASLDQQVEKKRLEVMAKPEVKKAYDAALAANRDISTKLLANPEYKELQTKKDAAQEATRTLKRPTGRDRDQWQEYGKKMRETWGELSEAQRQMGELVDNNPELVALKKKEEAAWIAALTALNTALQADTEFKQLEVDLKEVKDLLRQIEMERYQARRAAGGNERGGRGGRGGDRGGDKTKKPQTL